MRISSEIEEDVLSAEILGEREKEKFIDERLMNNSLFFDPIKRMRLKTMGDMDKKIQVSGSQKKIVELKQHSNIAFQLLVKSQALGQNLDLQEVMKYQLTPVPYCLGSSDGFLSKTNKAKGWQYLMKDVINSVPPAKGDTLLVVDGNAVFHSLTEIPDTFGDIAEKIHSSSKTY